MNKKYLKLGFQKGNELKLIQIIENLTDIQKLILNQKLDFQLNNLSKRSYNYFKKYFNSNKCISKLKPLYTNKTVNFKNKNIGVITEFEIKNFLDRIKIDIYFISNIIDFNKLKTELFKVSLINKFNLPSKIIDEICIDYDFEDGFPLFKTCNVLIENCILINKKEKQIFKNRFNYFKNQEVKSVKEISNEIKLTLERIRQLQFKILKEFNSKFSFIKMHEINSYNLYNIDFKSNLINIPEELITKINEYEKNSFNALFIKKILSILLDKSHTLIGNEEVIIFKKNN